MKKLSLLLITFSFFNLIYLTAQVPFLDWQKTFGGSDADIAHAIRQTNDNGYIVVGASRSSDDDVTDNHGNYDCWVIKISETGELQWKKSFGGTEYDYANDIQQTNDGGFIIAATTESSDGDVSINHGGNDYWILKLSNEGDLEWERSFGGSAAERASAVQQTNDGGYIVGGYSNSTDGEVTGNHGLDDYWVVKLSGNGNLEWEKSLGGTSDDLGFSIQQTIDNGYMIIGSTESVNGDVSNNYGEEDVWIVKLSTAGNMEWEKSFGGTARDVGRTMDHTSDGGFVIAGHSYSTDGDLTHNNGNTDLWVFKINESGTIEWQQSFGGTAEEVAVDIQQTNDEGYIIAGYTFSNNGDVTLNQGIADFWVLKLNSLGVLEWQQTFGGLDWDQAYAIQETNDDGFIIAGHAHSSNGDVTNNHGSADFWVVKLSPVPLAFNEIFESNPFRIYPNPADHEITLSVDDQLIGLSFTIYDSLGNLILSKKIRDKKTFIKVNDLSSGMYIIEIEAFNKIVSARFLKN